MLILPEGWQRTTIFASTLGDQLAIGTSVVVLILTVEHLPGGFGLPYSSLSRPAEAVKGCPTPAGAR